jgi:hypothetical protein
MIDTVPRHLVSMAEFARLQGWHRSTVTRLAAAGRIVLTAKGRVDVAASRQRLAETADPNRADVSERHTADRQRKTAAAETTADTANSPAGAPNATAPASSPVPAAENRATAPQSTPDGEAGADDLPADAPTAERATFASARARKEDALADIAEMERDAKRGALIPRTEVEAAIADVVAFVRQGLDNLPHAVAGSLVGQDFSTIHATLRDAIANLMRDMHTQAQRAAAELAKGEEVA